MELQYNGKLYTVKNKKNASIQTHKELQDIKRRKQGAE